MPREFFKKVLFVEAASDMETSFRLRRRERIEARILQKSKRNRGKDDQRTNAAMISIFYEKRLQKFNPWSNNHTGLSANRPSLPKPLYSKSERFPTVTPINLKKALRHLALRPHVSFLLLPWSCRMSPRWQNGPQGGKMEALGLPNERFWTPEITGSFLK